MLQSYIRKPMTDAEYAAARQKWWSRGDSGDVLIAAFAAGLFLIMFPIAIGMMVFIPREEIVRLAGGPVPMGVIAMCDYLVAVPFQIAFCVYFYAQNRRFFWDGLMNESRRKALDAEYQAAKQAQLDDFDRRTREGRY